MKILLIPLDERPVTYRLPSFVAKNAGISLITPPLDLMSKKRISGNPKGLINWIKDMVSPGDSLVISLESLIFGGLMSSRLGKESLGNSIEKIEFLEILKDVKVYVSSVIQRTPNANDAGEEPFYWQDYGKAIHSISTRLHRKSLGLSESDPDRAEPEKSQSDAGKSPKVPEEFTKDFFKRRLRNHILNLFALNLATTGKITHLVISSDDTSEFGVATAEFHWINNLINFTSTKNVSTYSGADEVACVLVTRACLDFLNLKPKVKLEFPGGLPDLIAPYENIPLIQSAVKHVEASGAILVDSDEADLFLVIAPPRGIDAGDWAPFPPSNPPPAQTQVVDTVLSLVSKGKLVSLADCAYPNGSDPKLIQELHSKGLNFTKLASYAGWNTAGNTIGSCLALGLTAWISLRQERIPPSDVIARRIMEDYGYMTQIRPLIRQKIGSNPTKHDEIPQDSPVVKLIEEEMKKFVKTLPGFPPETWKIESVRLPWDRTFEVDFEILPVDTPSLVPTCLVPTSPLKVKVVAWKDKLEADLFGKVLPFWLNHSIDPNGGFFNNLSRDGGVYDTRKHVWLQGRQSWLFSKVANMYSSDEIDDLVKKYPSIYKKPSKSLVHVPAVPLSRDNLVKYSKLTVDFLIENALQKQEPHHVYFCLTKDGKPCMIQRKPFSATFMIMALNSVYKVTGEMKYRKLALEMLDRCILWMKTGLGKPVLQGIKLQDLATPMILLNVIMELIPDQGLDGFYEDERKWCIDSISSHYITSSTSGTLLTKGIVVENVMEDGTLDESTPEGRCLNPGHAIECGWFLLDYSNLISSSKLTIMARNMIQENFKVGWDEKQNGGITYFLDWLNYTPIQLEWNMKLWWPLCESLVAFSRLFSSSLSCSDFHEFEKVASWIYHHLVDDEYGEWFGYTDVRGMVTHEFKGGPYKGCFHVPRALLYSIQSLEDAIKRM